MNYRFLNIILTASLFLCFGVNASAASAAFGFFINKSGNESLDYLEKILPNSFASALKNKHKFNIIKPAQIPALTFAEDSSFKTEFTEGDLVNITSAIAADYFIFGTFKSLENNRIILIVNVYKKGTTSVFQFEDTGYLETEVFKLIDKIALQINSIATDSIIFKNEKITAKSKLAVLTNIEGTELNTLYYEFLTSGYRLSPTQGNELHGIIDDKQINKFYHLSGANASYHQIHNKKDIELMYGTWSGTEYYNKIKEEKEVFDMYSFDDTTKKKEILKKIQAFSTDDIDYIIIIGFNETKTNAWIRCLNLKNNKLIITETGIQGSSITDITKNIIKSISTGLPEKI